MKICLKTQARQSGLQTRIVHIGERRPERLDLPCELTCTYQIENCSNYYLLTLNVSGMLSIVCQRCLSVFQHEYSNQTILAVCANDEIAETLMTDFECIVVDDNEIDLIDVVTDELYLFLPEKHIHLDECDIEMKRFIEDKY